MLNCGQQGGRPGLAGAPDKDHQQLISSPRSQLWLLSMKWSVIKPNNISGQTLLLVLPTLSMFDFGCRKGTGGSNNQLNYSGLARLTEKCSFSFYLFIMEVQYLRKFPRLCPFLLSFLPSAPKELFFLGLRPQSYIVLYYSLDWFSRRRPG